MNTMKLAMCILGIMAFNLFTVGANDNKVTPSEIKSVKVYTKGAVITRTAKLTVEPGTSTIEFDNLSSSIDKQSITVTGTGDVTILSVQYNLNYLNQEKKPTEIVVLEDSLKYINHEAAKLDNLKSVYDEEISMILSNKSIRDEREGVTADKLNEVANFYRSRLSDIKAKLLDIKDEQERLNRDKNRINNQLNVLNNNRNKPTGTINVGLSANTRNAVTLEISYLVSAAGWSPLYDIRAKDVSSPIQLNYKADILQNTGEDWKNVHIILSTGNPTLSGVIPTMNPWHLNFYTQARPAKKAYYKNEAKIFNVEQDNSRLSEKMDMAGARTESSSYSIAAAPLATTIADNTVEIQNQLSVDFDIAIPYSVPSDNKVYNVDVQHFELKSDYSYHAIPKLDKDAFLIAHVTGWEALNLLPGSANIYFENSFIGTSYLQLQNANDTLDISLGRDKKISINREKLKDFGKNQIVSGNMVKTMAYEITIRNSKSEAINLEIDDQLPISDNNQIVVKMLDNTNAEFNEKTGAVVWKLNIAPSATEKRKFSFNVKYPKDQNIPNL